MPWIIFGTITSYFLGSIPTAYVFGRLLKGIDIRKFGSGNIGATNALRVLGNGPGLAVLALDILKGFTSVVFLADFLSLSSGAALKDIVRIIMGFSCIAGHNWTLFLNFKGGKGVATTLGVLLGLATQMSGLRIALLLVFITWVIVFLIGRMVSLASVIAGICLPAYAIIFKQSHLLIIASVMFSLLVVLRHRANLRRILRGEEPRLTFRKS